MTDRLTLHARFLSFDLRHTLRRALAVALVLMMLSSQTPAAPQAFAGVGDRWRLNAWLWLQAGGWDASLRALISGQRGPSRPRRERQAERDARVRRIEIYPGDMEIALGERVQFTAVAYDGNDVPVGGVRFVWRGRDEGRGRGAQVTRTGTFEARATGNFKVIAEGAGQLAHITVRVRRGERPRHDERPIKLRDVSTDDTPEEAARWAARFRREAEKLVEQQARANRSVTYGKASFNHRVSTATSAAAPVPLLLPPPDDPYSWNSQNYMHGRDPDNGRGDPPGRPIDDGAGTGNFQIAAPLLGLPGRGIDLSLGLVYNSRLWTKTGNKIIFDADRDWPAPGWSLGFGRVVGMGTGGSLIIDPDGTRHGFTGQIYQYQSTGAVSFTGHTVDGTFIDYTSFSDGNGIRSATAKLPNGTVIEYGAPGDGAVYPTSITDANGNFVSIIYGNAANNYTGPRISIVTDTLGRTVKFHYDANNLLTAIEAPGYGGTLTNPTTRTLVRLHYRQLTLNYNNFGPHPLTAQVRNPTVWVIDAIYYPGTNTGYWFGDPTSSYSSYGMIAKVVEQRGMSFTGPAPSNTGPTEMGTVFPGNTTREQIYNYPLTPNSQTFLSDAPTYGTLTEKWAKDETNVNFEQTVTSYTVVKEAANPSQPTIPSRKVEITRLTDNVKSIQYSYNYTSLASDHPDKFKDGLVYQDETRDANNNLLGGSTVTAWEKGAYDSPRPVRVETLDDRGQKTAAAFNYDGPYNQVMKVRDYDYGGENLLRVTRTEYENSANYINRHIFNLVKKVEVFEANETTRLSLTEYQYDAGTLAETPGVTMHAETHNPYAPWYEVPCDCYLEYNQAGYEEYVCHAMCPRSDHDPSTNFRGNVTQVTNYADAATPAGALVETRAYDMTGNLITASSSCCEQTSATYTLDTQYAYPEAQTRGAAATSGPRVATEADYDFNTGLVKTGTDANGRTSQTIYFPNTLRPQASYSPTNARTEYAYDDTQMTVTETTYTAENALAAQSVRRLNGNGQVRREEAKGEGANVWDVVETKYDGFGRVSEQSRPYRQGAETPQWNKTFYDVLGRVMKVEAPDGSASESFYNEGNYPGAATQNAPGQTVRVRDAWGRERWGRTDAQGRLVEVVEPNPDGGGSVNEAGSLLTRYTYDTPGNLVEVTQGAQARRFRYDSLGRLTHQKLAETSATINLAGQFVGLNGTGAQWSDYFTYDTRSNLVTRTDARGVVTNFSYTSGGQPDPLNRLQSVSYTAPTGANIPAAATVNYVYETDATKDRTRVRQVVTAGISTEDFAVDAEGRLHQRTLTLNSRASYPFTTNYTYDSLDRVTDVTYPAQYGMTGNPRRVVHHDFDAASRLSGLKVNNVSHASEIAYNAASQTTALKVGAAGVNQLTETYAYDQLTGLLTGQKVFRGTDTTENRRLDLAYDYLREGTTSGRTGHLTKVTDNRDAGKNRHYEYDALGRLKRASAGGTQGSWAQRYLYDRYGNRSHALSQKTSDWVSQLYTFVLNRAADSGGLSAWDGVLRTGYAQGQSAFLQAAKDTAAGFFDSQEYLNRNRSNRDYVYDLYRAYLNREPDAGGWDAWTAALDAGTSRAAVRAGFADGIEFSNRVTGMYPTASTTAGAVPRDGHAYLSFDAATNRVNSPGWEYDAAGNQTRALLPSGGWRRFEYDAANRLVTIKDDGGYTYASYTYGDTNQRLSSYEGGYTRTYYVAEGGTVLAEYAESIWSTAPGWNKSYVYLGGRLLSTFSYGGGGTEVLEHHHPDRLGTRLVSNPSSGASFEQATLPFGNGLPSESTGTTSRRFTSYDRSGGTGLDYAVNRRYDPMQGRFTQVDPIEMDAVDLDDPQSLNLYSYVGNDPVNHVDPDGLFFKKLWNAIKKVFTSKWFVIAATVALAVITIGAAISPAWALSAKVFGSVTLGGHIPGTTGLVLHGVLLGTKTTALGWVAAGLGAALAIPAIDLSVRGILQSAASYGLSSALGRITPSIGATGSTPDWNPNPFMVCDYPPCDGIVQRAADFGAGVADGLFFGLPSRYRRWRGWESDEEAERRENSGAYQIGEVSGVVGGLAIGGGTVAARAGWTISAGRYAHGGGGINILKNGARRFALDHHKFKRKSGQWANRPHLHFGKTKNQLKKHRNFRGKPM
ncbi:MAG: DUF4214 domain-containing protein [Pyrinomonadaceae bacterium]